MLLGLYVVRVPFNWKLLTLSVPESRILSSMSIINYKKSFQSLLLGKERIQEKKFNNKLNYSDNSRLNESQKRSIQSVLNNDITFLQGPPGTGKTSTIYEIILQLIDQFHTFPILVVAASNIAIDNIAEKLMKTHQDKIIRVVSESKEKDYPLSHPLGPVVLHHKIQMMLSVGAKEVTGKLRSGKIDLISETQYKKYKMEVFDVGTRLMSQYQIMLTTTVTAGGKYFKMLKEAPVMIMDEATQSSEAATLIPLSMQNLKKAVFVGDQKQLSSFSNNPHLQKSLFERVIMSGLYENSHMLNRQYRMHPFISEFPRNRFYDRMLEDGISIEERKLENIEKPLVFWDTGISRKYFESRKRKESIFGEEQGYSFQNTGESELIISVLMHLIFSKNIAKEKIGIITPYSAQRELITEIITRNEILNPEGEDVIVDIDCDDLFDDARPATMNIISGITIASVDAFQGKEKDFIIFSCVRSNREGMIGFSKDERRLNVALTRARYGLILVGNSECLSRGSKLWKNYITSLKEQDFVFKVKSTQASFDFY
ncbi:DEAD/DEAH box helicase family protein [Ascoidea rubescens DSM 1968]|uniref:p-loop containing nucleoside triphosphate hydrolase protein n=1 Tax=Ascoidea rubescens DSM 1968 TaxID=1344418 RepID=A0A1D2VMJ1_9ASCO|nr:P-loop containing nucleoside triphosphate hydrolase protein [Ascoidea rubescens DSM 1968]ODV62831.1 P-loop containing nucleoside triphosphate hydrolase protein [Ascoidea rubescens DSM 1968]